VSHNLKKICQQIKSHRWKQIRTATNKHPDEVEEEVIEPEVISFWSTVRDFKQTRCIVKDIAIHLTHGNHKLQSITCGMLYCNAICDTEGKRAPSKLSRPSVTGKFHI
jgi:hypothetical protein